MVVVLADSTSINRRTPPPAMTAISRPKMNARLAVSPVWHSKYLQLTIHHQHIRKRRAAVREVQQHRAFMQESAKSWVCAREGSTKKKLTAKTITTHTALHDCCRWWQLSPGFCCVEKDVKRTRGATVKKWQHLLKGGLTTANAVSFRPLPAPFFAVYEVNRQEDGSRTAWVMHDGVDGNAVSFHSLPIGHQMKQ